MPSTATITAFYTFTANTKARASQANTNFSNFRGHMIPIDPNTITSVNNTYDLGHESKKWRVGYFNSIDVTGNATTSGYNMVIAGTATGGTVYGYSTGTATTSSLAGMAIIINSGTAMMLTSGGPVEGGIRRDAIAKAGTMQLANNLGLPGYPVVSQTFTVSFAFTGATTSGSAFVNNTTLTVHKFRNGGFFQAGLIGSAASPVGFGNIVLTIDSVSATSAIDTNLTLTMKIYKDTTTAVIHTWQESIAFVASNIPTTGGFSHQTVRNLPGMSAVFNDTHTTSTYFLGVDAAFDVGNCTGSAVINTARFIVKEML